MSEIFLCTSLFNASLFWHFQLFFLSLWTCLIIVVAFLPQYYILHSWLLYLFSSSSIVTCSWFTSTYCSALFLHHLHLLALLTFFILSMHSFSFNSTWIFPSFIPEIASTLSSALQTCLGSAKNYSVSLFSSLFTFSLLLLTTDSSSSHSSFSAYSFPAVVSSFLKSM